MIEWGSLSTCKKQIKDTWTGKILFQVQEQDTDYIDNHCSYITIPAQSCMCKYLYGLDETENHYKLGSNLRKI